MKKSILLCCLLITVIRLWAQGSFTEAYAGYRPYHYQTPQAWNRIRLEVADPGSNVWPLIEREPRFMYLTGHWKGLIPSPVPANTYMFRGLEDVGAIYELLTRRDAHGYIVYPYWLEEQIKLADDKNFGRYVIAKGFMNTLVTDLLSDIEDHLEFVVYTPDSVAQEATPPQVYGDDYTKWVFDSEHTNLYTIKNYYCFFDNRPDSVRQSVRYKTHVTKAFDSEVARLASRLDSADHRYVVVPYWMTDVYMALPKASSSRIRRFGYPAYVINPINGGVDLTNNWTSANVMDFAPYSGKPYDLIAYCGDARSINMFLANPEARLQFIYSVFDPQKGMINRNGFDRKPSGLNIFFPEFDFTEKRGLTQFIKSLSLVMDSLRVDTAMRYAALDLSLTLPMTAEQTHSDFVYGLQSFVDTVYFADFDAFGLADKVCYNDGSIDGSSVISRFINPFYLFRIPYKTIRPGANDGDLLELAQCDYDTGMWGVFFIIDVFLILLLATVFLLRYTSPGFNRFIEAYPTAMALIVITLVMEAGVFFFFMMEALSPQNIFFDMQTNSNAYLILIALPVLPIFFYFLFKYIYQQPAMP